MSGEVAAWASIVGTLLTILAIFLSQAVAWGERKKQFENVEKRLGEIGEELKKISDLRQEVGRLQGMLSGKG